jgi:two-component system, sensor histidine kinase RegB
MFLQLETDHLQARFLQFLLWVRMLAMPIHLVVLVVLFRVVDYPVDATLPILVIGLYLATTVYAWRQLQTPTRVTDQLLFWQLTIDVAALTALLFATAGAANPFTVLLLLPVTISAATLQPRATWTIVTLSVLSYSALMWAPQQSGHHHHYDGADIGLHLWGMWLGLVVVASLIAFFVARIGQTLRQHDRTLARAKDEALRAEHVINLANLAAGTAHELGAPLATIAVLATELQDESVDNKELRQGLVLLRGQVERCKEILSRMALDAGQSRADAGQTMALEEYIDFLLRDWSEQRPNVQLTGNFKGALPAPKLLADRSLTQAIQNVLNNAADASPENVRFDACWSDGLLTIQIVDDGEGIDPSKAKQIGTSPFSTKHNTGGLGFGVLVSRSVLERLGGRLTLSPGDGKGTCATIELPLGALATE